MEVLHSNLRWLGSRLSGLRGGSFPALAGVAVVATLVAGCAAGGHAAATQPVAPVAGLRFPSPCPAARAVPVIAFHGTADDIDPFEGNGQPYWTYSVPTAAQWALGHAVRGQPSPSSGRDRFHARAAQAARPPSFGPPGPARSP